MNESLDHAQIIAWIDGELDAAQAAEVEARVAQEPELAALAERHRRLKARFSAAFGPIAEQPVEVRPLAPPISLAAVRAEREQRSKAALQSRRWAWPSAIAASLLIGVLAGHQVLPPAGLSDRPDALALDRRIASALDRQLSGDAGPIRVALTFHDKQGDYCRSFTGTNLSGVACRTEAGWILRYGASGEKTVSAYRMAGADQDMMAAVNTMIAGEPFDRSGEIDARRAGWR